MLSGRGLCDELITRPEESYRLCCVVVCDLETSRIGAPYIHDISSLRVNELCRVSYRSLISGLFNDALSYREWILSSDWMTLDFNLVRMW